MPRSISNAASLRLASHQFHSFVFIVNCRLPESFDNVIVVTNGFITRECVGFNIDCRLLMVLIHHVGDWFYNHCQYFLFLEHLTLRLSLCSLYFDASCTSYQNSNFVRTNLRNAGLRNVFQLCAKNCAILRSAILACLYGIKFRYRIGTQHYFVAAVPLTPLTTHPHMQAELVRTQVRGQEQQHYYTS